MPRFRLVTDAVGVHQGLPIRGQLQFHAWRALVAAVLVRTVERTIGDEPKQEVWRVVRVNYRRSAADRLRGQLLAERQVAIVVEMEKLPR